MESGIFLSQSAVSALPDNLRDALLAQFGAAAPKDLNGTTTDATSDKLSNPFSRFGIVALTVAETEELVSGCSPKTKAVLKAMAKASTNGFSMEDAASELNLADFTDLVAELRGVWGGLTKRVRKVTNRGSAYLVHWVEQEDGEWLGRVAPQTLASLKAVFKV